MTGRMYLLPARAPLPKHAAVVLGLGRNNFVFEDTRYFGRLTLNLRALAKLGPEPLGPEFTVERFAAALSRSAQAIKVKLLDQSLLAGVGNIYASEALFRAAINPKLPARRLGPARCARLVETVRETLAEAIEAGGSSLRDYVNSKGEAGYFQNSFAVYDRAGKPCLICGTPIRSLVLGQRSTFYCPRCQR